MANMAYAKNVFGKITGLVRSNIKLMVLILIITGIFLGLSIYIYYSYIKKRLYPSSPDNKEFITKQSLNTCDLYFIYADWCPYSNKAKKIIEAYKKDTPVKNGISIGYIFIDGDKEEGKLIEFEQKHKKKVAGYPTIFLDIKGQLIEYDATINKDNLDEFFTTVI